MISSSRFSRILSRLERHRPPARLPGLPEGLEFETLAEVCNRHFGELPESISHTHLSSWKLAGTFRLFLTSKAGRAQTLIYKSAVYYLNHIPAIARLPVVPGQPEFLVYRAASNGVTDDSLLHYLPKVYLCEEVNPGWYYRYLLEDLGSDYRKPASPEDKVKIAAALPELQRAMRASLPEIEQKPFLRFDYAFTLALQEYVCNYLETYLRLNHDRIISSVNQRWTAILSLHRRKEFHDMHELLPVHGDLNTTNIHIHHQQACQFKFVDWEWAGVGLPHADLASLLKRASPDTERRALEVFAQTNRALSLAEHLRLYEWCRLERGLLDAAFLAVQRMESPVQPQMDMSAHVRSALERVLSAYHELTR